MCVLHVCLVQVTYTLPGDYVQFCTEFAKRHDVDAQRNYWIMKPAGSSRGRGIFVFNDIGAVSYTECVIVQRWGAVGFGALLSVLSRCSSWHSFLPVLKCTAHPDTLNVLFCLTATSSTFVCTFA